MNLAQAFYVDERGRVRLREGVLCGALLIEALRCPRIVVRSRSAMDPVHYAAFGEQPVMHPERDPGRRGLKPGIPRKALEHLAGVEKATAQEIAALLKANSKLVAVGLNALRAMGFVDASGPHKPKRHWITDKGRRELKIIKAQELEEA